MAVHAIKNTKGFTLVELIVVITILAILATVGFLSLQGYTDDAKTTKTQANLRTVASSLVNDQAITSNSFTSYLTDTAANRIAYGTATAFSGTAITLTGAAPHNYAAGPVIASALRLDGAKFFDNNSAGTLQPFVMGALTITDKSTGKDRLRPVFQVTATVKGGGVQQAIVEGNYGTGIVGDLYGLVKATAASPGSTIANLGGTVSAGNVQPVVQGSTTNLPYALQ